MGARTGWGGASARLRLDEFPPPPPPPSCRGGGGRGGTEFGRKVKNAPPVPSSPPLPPAPAPGRPRAPASRGGVSGDPRALRPSAPDQRRPTTPRGSLGRLSGRGRAAARLPRPVPSRSSPPATRGPEPRPRPHAHLVAKVSRRFSRPKTFLHSTGMCAAFRRRQGSRALHSAPGRDRAPPLRRSPTRPTSRHFASHGARRGAASPPAPPLPPLLSPPPSPTLCLLPYSRSHGWTGPRRVLGVRADRGLSVRCTVSGHVPRFP